MDRYHMLSLSVKVSFSYLHFQKIVWHAYYDNFDQTIMGLEEKFLKLCKDPFLNQAPQPGMH